MKIIFSIITDYKSNIYEFVHMLQQYIAILIFLIFSEHSLTEIILQQIFFIFCHFIRISFLCIRTSRIESISHLLLYVSHYVFYFGFCFHIF